MEKVKKIILLGIPMSICNFRCHYCYLAQREESYQGIQPKMKYSPAEVAQALSYSRIGGAAFINMCADGETLLTHNIDQYIKALLEQGHFIELVTNLTNTPMLNKILSFDSTLLKHLEFKCSFHYLQLKEKKLLGVFAENVKNIWRAGASANIEMTPNDELISYIDEIKSFSYANFGALPHLTIARDDRTKNIEMLTALPYDDYVNIWKQFDSSFWDYKLSMFGKKQTRFCYAGAWSLFINLASGQAKSCYCGSSLGDVFADPSKPLPQQPIGKCPLAHCYNCHALQTMGLIPYSTDIGYGDIRNRKKTDGTSWLNDEVIFFFNSKLVESNEEWTAFQKIAYKSSHSTLAKKIKAKLTNK